MVLLKLKRVKFGFILLLAVGFTQGSFRLRGEMRSGSVGRWNSVPWRVFWGWKVRSKDPFGGSDFFFVFEEESAEGNGLPRTDLTGGGKMDQRWGPLAEVIATTGSIVPGSVCVAENGARDLLRFSLSPFFFILGLCLGFIHNPERRSLLSWRSSEPDMTPQCRDRRVESGERALSRRRRRRSRPSWIFELASRRWSCLEMSPWSKILNGKMRFFMRKRIAAGKCVVVCSSQNLVLIAQRFWRFCLRNCELFNWWMDDGKIVAEKFSEFVCGQSHQKGVRLRNCVRMCAT